MAYVGDYTEDYADLNIKFTTVNTSGVPTILAGSPVVSVYKSNDTTQSTAGVTLSVDFDTITGLNNVKIDLSADAFYESGKDYQIIVTTGTVGGSSIVGYQVGEFSIDNRSGSINKQMTESYAADGVAPTPAQALLAIMQGIGEFDITGVTRTVKKIDKSTTAQTFTLNDADSPTSTTRSA